MIFSESLLRILDNSGAKTAKCLRVYTKPYGSVGDAVLVSVRKYVPNKKITKGTIFKAVLVKTKRNVYRKTGQYLKAKVNGIVLVKKEENSPVGKRVKSFVFLEVRHRGYSRVVSMSPGIL